MRRAMRKSRYLTFKRFNAQLTKLNNYPPLFHGSSAYEKMDPRELNDTLLHAVPNGWTKQAYLQGWEFEGKSYKDTCNFFERMEIAEQVYEGVTPSKTTTREEADCVSHGRRHKGGEAASPTNPKKGRTGKRKNNNTGHQSYFPTGGGGGGGGSGLRVP